MESIYSEILRVYYRGGAYQPWNVGISTDTTASLCTAVFMVNEVLDSM